MVSTCSRKSPCNTPLDLQRAIFPAANQGNRITRTITVRQLVAFSCSDQLCVKQAYKSGVCTSHSFFTLSDYNLPADWTSGGHVKHHRPKDVPFGQEPPRSHVPQGGPRGQRLFDHPRAHGSPVMDCKIPIHFSLQLKCIVVNCCIPRSNQTQAFNIKGQVLPT